MTDSKARVTCYLFIPEILYFTVTSQIHQNQLSDYSVLYKLQNQLSDYSVLYKLQNQLSDYSVLYKLQDN